MEASSPDVVLLLVLAGTLLALSHLTYRWITQTFCVRKHRRYKANKWLQYDEWKEEHGDIVYLQVGRLFAENTIFLMATSLLKVLNILPPSDGPMPEPTSRSVFFSLPLPFHCIIVARSDTTRVLVHACAQAE